MIRPRAVPLLFAVAAFAACSSDKRTGPDNPLASQLSAIADSSEIEDYRIASALYSASTMVRAGGRVSAVTIVIDSQPRAFNAVGMRISYSPTACQQLRTLFDDGRLTRFDENGQPGDSLFISFDPCKPHQSFVAWEGDDLSRIAVVHGDTGTNSMTADNYSFSFFAEVFDRITGKDWMSISGTSSNGFVARGPACRETAREEGVRFNCRLVTLSQSFDLVLQEWPEFDVDSTLIPLPPNAFRRLGAADTAVVFDTTDYGWEMGPTHTVAMGRHVINGLSMEVTSFNFERRFGRSMAAATAARLRRARTSH